MAIRNTILEGRDWLEGEAFIAVDINDTFDEIAEIVEAGY